MQYTTHKYVTYLFYFIQTTEKKKKSCIITSIFTHSEIIIKQSLIL
jgi:hypothetical protein